MCIGLAPPLSPSRFLPEKGKGTTKGGLDRKARAFMGPTLLARPTRDQSRDPDLIFPWLRPITHGLGFLPGRTAPNVRPCHDRSVNLLPAPLRRATGTLPQPAAHEFHLPPTQQPYELGIVGDKQQGQPPLPARCR